MTKSGFLRNFPQRVATKSKATLCFLSCFLCFGLADSQPAFSEDKAGSIAEFVITLGLTAVFLKTPKQEATRNLDTLDSEKLEAKLNGEVVIGAMRVNGSPFQTILPSPDLNPIVLSFNWIDPATSAVVTGLDASAVTYFSYIEGAPISLDVSDSSVWTNLGTSTDGSSGFSLSLKIPTGEQIFLAEPLDSAGAPLFISGVHGYNDALGEGVLLRDIPEPATWVLILTGFFGLALGSWRGIPIFRPGESQFSAGCWRARMIAALSSPPNTNKSATQ
jgi:hypothetical protein